MTDDIVQDTLAQAALFALIAIAFILIVVQSTDLSQFYMRYYTKDVGTIVEATHAMKGEAELRYESIHPSHQYLFNFTGEGVYIAPSQNMSKPIAWRVRQQYGRAIPLPVTESLLENPSIITIYKEKNITFDQPFPAETCPQAAGAMRRVESALLLEGIPLITENMEKLVFIKELEQNVGATQIITITLAEGEPGVRYGTGESVGLACLYSQLLTEELSVPFPTSSGGTGLSIQLTLPQLTEREATVLAPKLALPLDTFLRS